MSGERPEACDVAIVGGGPAGLSAAIELRRLGATSVTIVERESEAGGIPRHCGHFAFGMREMARVLRGPDYAARLVETALRAGVRIMTRSTVTALQPGPLLSLSTPRGLASLTAGRVLIATGCRERTRAARLIGGTKPGGVLSTGALQGLVYLDGLVPFTRPVVLGTELVSFSALLTCRHAGMKPAAMIEPGPRVIAWTGSPLLPRVLGVPLILETEAVAIRGASQVEAVDVRGRDGTVRSIATDGVIVSGQFVPEATLVRGSHLAADAASGGPVFDQFLRLSDSNYFAAGNLLRPVETAGWCWLEGRTAARMIAMSLAGRLPPIEDAVCLSLAGPPLKLALPQRLASTGVDGALGHIQLRVTKPVRGRLSIAIGGRTVWSRAIRALPERRILVPLTWLAPGMSGNAEIALAHEAS